MTPNVLRKGERSENRKGSLSEHCPQTGLRLGGNPTVESPRMIVEILSTRTKGVVLVIDRDPAKRNVICQELTRHGYMVLEAANSEQAIVIMQQCEVPL